MCAGMLQSSTPASPTSVAVDAQSDAPRDVEGGIAAAGAPATASPPHSSEWSSMDAKERTLLVLFAIGFGFLLFLRLLCIVVLVIVHFALRPAAFIINVLSAACRSNHTSSYKNKSSYNVNTGDRECAEAMCNCITSAIGYSLAAAFCATFTIAKGSLRLVLVLSEDFLR
jgi:hypothetical protein